MRESILTIPITDVFEPKCGCPICRIRDTLEQHTIEYIMGAAMMEPDVRIETNKAGFCKEHFEQMRACKNRRFARADAANTFAGAAKARFRREKAL